AGGFRYGGESCEGQEPARCSARDDAQPPARRSCCTNGVRYRVSISERAEHSKRVDRRGRTLVAKIALRCRRARFREENGERRKRSAGGAFESGKHGSQTSRNPRGADSQSGNSFFIEKRRSQYRSKLKRASPDRQDDHPTAS